MSEAQTVSSLSIVSMIITLVLCFGVPIALAIWAKLRYKKAFSFVPLLLGAAGFLVFQGIIRIPILQVLGQMRWFQAFAENNFWWYALLLSFTAGLFEEPARFIVFSILKKRRSYVDGLSYGIGHGGIESMLIVGLAYVNNLVLSIMINTGTINSVIEATPESARATLSKAVGQLSALDSSIFLAAGVERLLTVFVHIGLTLLVLRGFQTGKRWLWLGIAIAAHTVVNLTVIGLAHTGLSGWALEGVVAMFAALSLWLMVAQARAWRRLSSAQPTELSSEAG